MSLCLFGTQMRGDASFSNLFCTQTGQIEGSCTSQTGQQGSAVMAIHKCDQLSPSTCCLLPGAAAASSIANYTIVAGSRTASIAAVQYLQASHRQLFGGAFLHSPVDLILLGKKLDM
jgi:hypothetical protein